jgi:putative spermidine/putrescine transport system permease protein
MEGLLARIGLRIWVAAVLLFLFVPIAIICLYAFNSSNIQSWPIAGLSTKWFSVAWRDPEVRAAFALSVKAGLFATAVALLLGSAAAFGVHRFRFFGREAVSLLLVLPLALPGIITGIALNSAFSFAGIDLSVLTIIIGHATFCIVVVYNNVLARLRRTSGSLYEAAADLGASGLFTFRTVTLPVMSTALISGALLAFALSFDEVIVTTFTAGAQNTLPLWIFGSIRLGQQLPEVNVVVAFVLLLTVIPVAIAVRLTGGGGMTRASAGGARRMAPAGPGGPDGPGGPGEAGPGGPDSGGQAATDVALGANVP